MNLQEAFINLAKTANEEGVAVDLSGGGAADPASGDSLHRLEARTGENVYTTAIRTVGDILQDYDYGQPLEVNQQSVGIEYESMM